MFPTTSTSSSNQYDSKKNILQEVGLREPLLIPQNYNNNNNHDGTNHSVVSSTMSISQQQYDYNNTMNPSLIHVIAPVGGTTMVAPRRSTTKCTISSLHTISFVTGATMALMSQIILSILMWDNNILQKSTKDVIMFSLSWSFWTCSIVFVSMTLLMNYIRTKYLDHQSTITPTTLTTPTTTKTNENEMDHNDLNDTIFQMEAYYVIGALLSTSMVWFFNDLVEAAETTSTTDSTTKSILSRGGNTMQIHPILTISFAAIAYGIFVRYMLMQRKNYDGLVTKEMDQYYDKNDHSLDKVGSSTYVLASTFQLISATLGITIGVSSQFLLCFYLWKDGMTQPIFESVLLFSMLWSSVTVVLTFLGCLSLRYVIQSTSSMMMMNGSGSCGNDENGRTPTILERIQYNRILLRMEAAYVSSSLIGICSAWIIIDVLTGMTDQILPSIFMLVLSLLAFRAILYFFPEENCIETEKDTTTTVEFV